MCCPTDRKLAPICSAAASWGWVGATRKSRYLQSGRRCGKLLCSAQLNCLFAASLPLLQTSAWPRRLLQDSGVTCSWEGWDPWTVCLQPEPSLPTGVMGTRAAGSRSIAVTRPFLGTTSPGKQRFPCHCGQATHLCLSSGEGLSDEGLPASSSPGYFPMGEGV